MWARPPPGSTPRPALPLSPTPGSVLHILPGDPPVPVALRRSGRARRLSLRVSAADGRVTLTLPPRTPWREGLLFLQSREAWLRGHLARSEEPIRPAFGGEIPFAGGTLRLEEGARTLLDGDTLRLPAAAMPRRLGAWLKAQARSRLAEASERHAASLGRQPSALSIRDPRSRWGSCSAGGRLMFSWRLVLAPPSVLDYVAAHEAAHLARMDHSPAFWALVERLRPDWREDRAWLRRHGSQLHRLRLD